MDLGKGLRRASWPALLAAAGWLAFPAAGALADGDGETPGEGAKEPAPEKGKDPAKDGEGAKREGDAASGGKPEERAGAAPAFRLKDVDGREHSLADYEGKIVILEWVNHGCPYVKKHYASGNMQALQKKYVGKGAVWLTVCSSAEGKQGHMSGKDWKEKNAALKIAATAVLVDADGTVGRAYRVARTPHMAVIGKDGNFAFRGAIDDRPTAKAEDVKGARNYVAEAVDALLEGKAPEVREAPAYG